MLYSLIKVYLSVAAIIISVVVWFAFYWKTFPQRAPNFKNDQKNGSAQIDIVYERQGEIFWKPPYIAIDMGHSIQHPGATSARGKLEFDFNLNLANTIEKTLRDSSFSTHLGNEDGHTTVLLERVKLPKGVDLLLSIHHDSVQPKFITKWSYGGKIRNYSDIYKGFSLFVSRLNPYVSESQTCASAFGKTLQAHGFEPSRYHAEPISGENKPFADEKNGVHYYDNLVVLKNSPVPAVLLEAGVIVNRGEEVELEEVNTQQAIAAAIKEGLQACLVKERGKRGSLEET